MHAHNNGSCKRNVSHLHRRIQARPPPQHLVFAIDTPLQCCKFASVLSNIATSSNNDNNNNKHKTMASDSADAAALEQYIADQLAGLSLTVPADDVGFCRQATGSPGPSDGTCR